MRVHEIYELLLVLVFEALHQVLGTQIQDLSTNYSKQRMSVKNGI